MGSISIIFCLILLILLILNFWKDRLGNYLLPARIFTAGAIIFYYIYAAFIGNIGYFKKDYFAVQIINRIPENLDFYVVEVDRNKDKISYEIFHSGVIRSKYFRVEFLDLSKGRELWFTAFNQKKELVYFTQRIIVNENLDQKIEVSRYFNQSKKLSAIATIKVKQYQMLNIKNSIWISLAVLLLFLNLILIFRNSKSKIN